MAQFDFKSPLSTTVFILKIGGLWPRGDQYSLKSSYTFYALTCYFCLGVCHNLSQVINVYFIRDQLQTLTASVIITVNEVTGMVKFALFYKNIRIVKKLMAMLDGELFQPTTSKQNAFLQEILTSWRRVYVIFSTLSVMTLLLWGLYPIFNKSYTIKKLPFSAWYPYDYKTSPVYELTYFYQLIANYYIPITNQNIDAFVSALLMYISAQCDLLCDHLRNLEKNDRKVNFVRCLKHQQDILRFTENTNTFLSVITMVQFMASVISICLTMFVLTLETPMTSQFNTLVCCLSAVFIELFVYCWYGNEVIIKSNRISYSAYKSGFWIDARLSKQKDLVFFLMKNNNPIKLRAVNFFELSLETFTSILKSSWSYFALLRQINNVDKN